MFRAFTFNLFISSKRQLMLDWIFQLSDGTVTQLLNVNLVYLDFCGIQIFRIICEPLLDFLSRGI